MLKPVVTIAALLTIGIANTAQAQSWQPVKPFKADYKAYFKNAAIGHGSRTLEAKSNGNYEATSTAKVLGGVGMSYDDTSYFRYKDHKIVTEKFSRYKRVFLGSTTITGKADGKGGLIVKSDNKTKHFPAGSWGNTLDSTAFQIQFQNDVKSGQTSFHYHYVEGDKIKDYKFKIDGTETLKVPAGTFKTIRLKRIQNGDRQTYMWLAPKLDYQLIKLQVLRKGKQWSAMELTDFKFQ
ncbi:DUF3108 domain-containing protein [Celerinatantimonas diazotrophica]|uniref:Uncharacterized protein DUF3108 n=1 Tax=Celerinatantimonas diazotrophica TaxID=412034 RepID=A0A4R1K658_9GAMM|nr:DUF3108 domain-containing protein [Celerinatantimonas diazotrophica]TCK58539.1 uncharacterized protein DUF3108 [Celerinatantimonas diazotrophica]CAG9297168.1 hypothetical protein CEDIAZO_02336 [Celerinatantimonas diazotrophica]